MADTKTQKTGVWIVTVAVLVALIAAGMWWYEKPWAKAAEKEHLAEIRDALAADLETNPPAPGWKVLAVRVAPPGLVIDLEIPQANVNAAEQMPLGNRLMTAGAICPASSDPIYTELGRFDIEIHPQAGGEPALVKAGCRNVREIERAG
jgi:hypothetical protein